MTTAICIATGASLTREDVELCRGQGRIYAVKEAYLIAPWADVLYCGDTDWWQAKKGVPDFAGEKWTVSDEAAREFCLNHVEGCPNIDWGDSMQLIAYGGNSGFQALNLAAVQGASRVILLGFDYRNPPGAKHFYDHSEHDRESRPSDYGNWLPRIRRAAALIKIPVINCSPSSAIDCFPMMPIREALAC